MHILLTGGTGFIGASLCHRLHDLGHQLTVLSRKPESVKALCGKEVLAIQALSQLSTQDEFDVIINLAGIPIADKRWTSARKKALEDSRVGITHALVDFIGSCQKKPEVLISGSAVGFYGDCGDTLVDEDSPFHEEYSHELCQRWEQEALLSSKRSWITLIKMNRRFYRIIRCLSLMHLH
ncbi:MAG: NAD-dependent epimerase/dehydratase family protein [Pseudomonadales bacterium]|nr:NAD-dependent epimerase/dehydratase family protein [Pseudomonadales bacterium]